MFFAEMGKQQYVIMPVSHYWIICLYLLSWLLIFKHLFHWGGKDKAISSYISCPQLKKAVMLSGGMTENRDLLVSTRNCFTLLSEQYLQL